MAQAVLNWTPAGGTNSTGQKVEYKKYNDSTWIEAASVGASISTYTISSLLDNTIYDFRVINICQVGGPTPATMDQKIRFVCPTVTLTPTYNQIGYSFTHVGAGITKYVIELLDSAGVTIIATDTVATPGSTVSGNFTGLNSTTGYKVRLTMYASTLFNSSCALQAVSTSAPPSCNPPTNVVATIS